MSSTKAKPNIEIGSIVDRCTSCGYNGRVSKLAFGSPFRLVVRLCEDCWLKLKLGVEMVTAGDIKKAAAEWAQSYSIDDDAESPVSFEFDENPDEVTSTHTVKPVAFNEVALKPGLQPDGDIIEAGEIEKAVAGWLRSHTTLKEQAKELAVRLKDSLPMDDPRREKILQVATDGLCDGFGSDDCAIDDDAPINDNNDDGYWVTCRVFVRYDEVDDYHDEQG